MLHEMFSQPVISESVDIELFDSTTSTDICLTESGSIDVELPEHVQVHPEEDIEDFVGTENIKTYYFEGRRDSNTCIELRDVLIKPSVQLESETRFYVKGISPREVIFDSSDSAAIVGKEVTVQIDLMCFLPSNPQRDIVEDDPLLERDEWSVYGYSVDDQENRIELIKEYKRHLRTATIEIHQEVNGPPSRQVEKALDKLKEIIELVSFIQGVEPTPIRAQVTAVSGKPYDERYEHWFSTYSKSIGYAFLGENLIWGDLREYLDEAYDDYLHNRDPYRLNMVLSWYLDAINTSRTLDTKLASLCNGIELFAKRYSDLGPGYNKTRQRIGHLVNTLDVETEDLAAFSGTYNLSERKVTDDNTDRRCSHEYFYSYSRQYVIHGDNLKIRNNDLYRDYEAVLVLFQRLLAHQFLNKDDLDAYYNLKNLSPEDSRLQ